MIRNLHYYRRVFKQTKVLLYFHLNRYMCGHTPTKRLLPAYGNIIGFLKVFLKNTTTTGTYDVNITTDMMFFRFISQNKNYMLNILSDTKNDMIRRSSSA